MGKMAFLIDDASDIQEAWVKHAACVGVTAGASAPDILVQNVISRLQELGGGEAVPLEGREENIVLKSRKNCASTPAKSNRPFSDERPAPPVLAFLPVTLS